MENRKIVKRVYTKLNGKSVKKTMYVASPKDATGHEMFNEDIEKAYIFKDDDFLFNYYDCKIKGNDRSGDFEYTQKILTVCLKIK